jgi:hypothetical protein
MQILPLLHKSLKDDAILEILEWGDGYVIYDFDLSHENRPDVYYAHCKKRGICMSFNEDQKLDTIFLYILGVEGYTALDLAEVEDITFFHRFSDAEQYSKSDSLKFKTGSVPEKKTKWLRIEWEAYHIHYEFREQELRLVTIMASKAHN